MAVKYYTLLPSAKSVGSAMDNVQWEMILRSVSAHRSFRWLGEGEMTASGIAAFLIFDPRFPRLLYFASGIIDENLSYLAKDYGVRMPCHDLIEAHLTSLRDHTIGSVFDIGLHQFIGAFIRSNNAIGTQIEQDYRFNG